MGGAVCGAWLGVTGLGIDGLDGGDEAPFEATGKGPFDVGLGDGDAVSDEQAATTIATTATQVRKSGRTLDIERSLS